MRSSEMIAIFVGMALSCSVLVGGIVMAATGASAASTLLVVGGAILGGIGILAWIAWVAYLLTT